MPVRALLRACHPGPVAGVTTLTAVLAVGLGHAPGRAALLTAAVLAGQLPVGWINDVVDRHRDLRTGRAGKPIAAGEVAPTTALIASAIALVACIALSLAAGPRAGALHLAAVAAALAYDLGVKATIASVVPYAVAFALLPAFVITALPGSPPPAPWVLAAGALLGSGAHFANVLPDLADDLATGVRGLGQRLGSRATLTLAVVLFAAGLATLAAGVAGAL